MKINSVVVFAFIFLTATAFFEVVTGRPLIPGTLNVASYSAPSEMEVRVQIVNRKRVRRHLSPLSMSKSDVADFEYHLNIDSISVPAPSFSYDVKLQPVKGSVFGPGFKYTTLGSDGAGNAIKNTVFPSRDELDSLETKLYTDIHRKSFVKLEHDEDGDLSLHGVVNGARIRTRRDAASGEKKTTMKVTDLTPPAPKGPRDYQDYYLLPANYTFTGRAGEVPTDGYIDTVPELALVLDYRMSQDIGKGREAKLEYAAITVNGINGFFELTETVIGIRCQLVHVFVIESPDQQPFMTNTASSHVKDQDKNLLWTVHPAKPLLTHYMGWVYENRVALGEYDMAPLLFGARFEGTTAGIAATPGACVFDNGQLSAASPTGSDLYANFDGIPILAHEIGHNMGAPHDGDAAEPSGSSYSIPDASACPFGDGFLMGYERNGVYTKPFRFSKCSLEAIKAYVSTEDASCLLANKKTGRTQIYQTLREAGEVGGVAKAFDPVKRCKNEPQLSFQGTVAYQIPDMQCRALKCELSTGTSLQIVTTSTTAARGTPCGDNPKKGKCRSGFCVGQGPGIDLDTMCQIVTGRKNSKVETGRELACSGGLWQCDNGRYYKSMEGLVPAPGTRCDGEKICFNKECVSRDEIKDPNVECIVFTGKQEAKKEEFKSSNGKCSGLTLCTYGSEFELMGGASTDPECNREAANLMSRRNPYEYANVHDIPPRPVRVIPPNPKILEDETPGDSGDGNGGGADGNTPDGVGPSSSAKSRTLQAVCDEVSPGSSVLPPAGGGRNELCSALKCKSVDGSAMKHNGHTPDETICGPLRRCKKGNCDPCGGRN